MAGVGSGKTFIGAILSMEYIVNFPYVRGFIGANTYGQLSKSTLSGIFKVWNECFGLIEGVHYLVDKRPPESWVKYNPNLKDYSNTITFNNGHLIFTASLDNYKTIDGTEFSYAILDETKDTREEAVKEVIIARLRQIGMFIYNDKVIGLKRVQDLLDKGELIKDKSINDKNGNQLKGFNPLYILTSPAKVEWINQWFDIQEKIDEIHSKVFSKTDFYYYEDKSKSITICSTFHNEKNLAPGYIDKLIESYSQNPSLIDMLIYGYPIAKSGGEWFSRFEREKHVKKLEYDENYPLHITFDFNVVPYMTMLVCQLVPIGDRVEWRTIKEYTLKNPKNNTESVCEEFLYDFAGRTKGVYFYGDPSGKNRSTVSKNIRHNYQTIEEVLRPILNNNSDRVIKTAPSLPKCRDFFNRILAGNTYVDILIDENCKELIADFELLKEDINGGYKKPKKKDSLTGESYESRGHCADAWRYLGVKAFEDLYNRT